jgi:hypothetical protein
MSSLPHYNPFSGVPYLHMDGSPQNKTMLHMPFHHKNAVTKETLHLF